MLRTASTLLFTSLERHNVAKVPLRTLIEGVQYGYTASATSTPVGPRFVRITDLKDGRIHWSGVPYCDCPDFAPYALKVDDILFALIFKDQKYCPEFRFVREESGKIVRIWNKGQPECVTDYNP